MTDTIDYKKEVLRVYPKAFIQEMNNLWVVFPDDWQTSIAIESTELLAWQNAWDRIQNTEAMPEIPIDRKLSEPVAPELKLYTRKQVEELRDGITRFEDGAEAWLISKESIQSAFNKLLGGEQNIKRVPTNEQIDELLGRFAAGYEYFTGNQKEYSREFVRKWYNKIRSGE